MFATTIFQDIYLPFEFESANEISITVDNVLAKRHIDDQPNFRTRDYLSFTVCQLRWAARLLIPETRGAGGLAHTGNKDQLISLLQENKISPNQIRSCCDSSNKIEQNYNKRQRISWSDIPLDDLRRACREHFSNTRGSRGLAKIGSRAEIETLFIRKGYTPRRVKTIIACLAR